MIILNNMNTKKIIGIILQAPLAVLNIATLGVGIYAAMGNVPGFYISWGAPAIIAGLIAAYIFGSRLSSSANNQDEVSTEYVEVTDDYPDQQSY